MSGGLSGNEDKDHVRACVRERESVLWVWEVLVGQWLWGCGAQDMLFKQIYSLIFVFDQCAGRFITHVKSRGMCVSKKEWGWGSRGSGSWGRFGYEEGKYPHRQESILISS